LEKIVALSSVDQMFTEIIDLVLDGTILPTEREKISTEETLKP
jgi:hypothetical protein